MNAAPAPIDLRSDTVTKPSPGMRRAMAEAEVGDDVLDGDPTTRRLEERIAELVGGAVQPASPHVPRATALAIENTHNAAGGRVLGPAAVDGLVRAARAKRLAAAAGVTPARLAQGADTVMVSVSKGLGCPVGSCLGFRKEWRGRAWEIRKRLGGGMRQSGILAAAGLYALDHNLRRIGEDHANAKRFAELLSASPAVRPSAPETNIVMVDLLRDGDSSDSVAPRLAQAGVRLVSVGPRRLRAVTHLDVSRADVERAARIIVETLR